MKKMMRRIISFVITILIFLQIIPINSAAIEIRDKLTSETMGQYILSPTKEYDLGRAGLVKLNEYN